MFTQVPVGNGAVAFKLAEPEAASIDSMASPLSPSFLLAERYQIIERIGEGGFGIVYKARDTKNHQRLVAVKQINLDQLSPREIIQATDSYNREVTFHPSLVHRNIPCVYDHFTDPRHWYLVMEYIQGETLEEYLKRVPGGKLPLKMVLTIGIQLCDVLHYLHKTHGIIFRDVKPANIMRTRHGRLYLIDFGIARRHVPGKVRDTTPLGSPGYAAPEQYGTAQSSERTDIYGLGATLLTLLNGIDLSEDVQGQTTPASHYPHFPGKLQILLDQMLARDVDQRPAHIGIVKRRLLFIRDGILGRIARNALTILTGIFLGGLPYLLNYLSATTPFSIQLSILSILIGFWMFLIGIGLLFIRRWRLLGLTILTTLILSIILIFL